VPTVAYCDLIKDTATYDQKIIRVRAVYFKGFESSVFYDDACRGQETWVNFDPAYQESTEPKSWTSISASLKPPSTKIPRGFTTGGGSKFLRSADSRGLKRTHEFDGKTYTSGFGHLDEYDYQLTILSIEDAKAVPKKAAK
jgi:hypothetical protein